MCFFIVEKAVRNAFFYIIRMTGAEYRLISQNAKL